MEFIGHLIARFVDMLSQQTAHAWQTITFLNISFYQIVIDITVVSILFYLLIQLVRGTKAKQIVTGLLLLAALYALSRILNLIALEWLLRNFFTLTLVAIPIIFQQEIRRGLQKIGQARFIARSDTVSTKVINEVVHAVVEMSKVKCGALIVFQKDVDLEEFEESGVELSAKVTQPLLLSIFNTKSPLHDGAVIIRGDVISSAAAILPQSTHKFDKKFGTRHKAAITLSEQTDAVVVVVSEERKSISVCHEGHLHENLSEKELINLLTDVL